MSTKPKSSVSDAPNNKATSATPNSKATSATPKSKDASATPNNKATPATPRIVKPSRGLAKSDTNSLTPQQNSRIPVDKSPRSVTSKPTIEKRSPRLSTPPDKKPSRILKPSEIQAELNIVQEDLKKAKEKFIEVEKEKSQALDELKEAQRLAEEANVKLREAMVAQKRAEENSEIEKFRAVEMEQAGIEAAHKKEEDWQRELESVRNQHAQDVAALLTATDELEKVKQELTMMCDAKKQALIHAEDATKIAETQAEKVEKLSAEVVHLKSLLDSRTEAVADENVQLVAGLKQEIETLRQELTRISDAKNQALAHADDATKIAENHAEKVEKLEAEVVQLKSLYDSKNEADEIENAKVVAELKLEIETLREEVEKLVELKSLYDSKNEADAIENAKVVAELKLEIEKSKKYEKKMIEYEATMEQLNIDLEAAKLSESYSHNLVEECKKMVEELEIEASEAKQLERSASESLESIMKQLEGSNDLLHDAESEILSLKEKVGLLEITIKRQKGEFEQAERRFEVAEQEALKMQETVESLKSELDDAKEEKNQAINNDKLAAASIQTLLEEKNDIITELEKSREEEEKSKKAMESLASALHEVSSEAREAKEQLLLFNAERESFETELEDLKLVLKATNEKYEHMLDDAKQDMDNLADSLEQSKQENQKLKDEWDQKEVQLMHDVKVYEEKNSSMENEIARLVNSLQEAEEEETYLRNSIKEHESEVIYLKDVLGGAKAESMQLKESLMDKENELQNILHENEELRARDAASLKKVEELTKLLEEASSRKQAEEDELSESEKDYDMLPKVVEFSEQNGGGREEMPKFEVVPQQHDQSFVPHIQMFNNVSQKEAVHANEDTENSNDKKSEGTDKKTREPDDSEEVEFKMWESCKIEEKDFSPEREQENEACEDDTDSKAEGSEILDHTNGLNSTESISNGGTSPLKQPSQKKKKPLLHKFGSLLKKKGTSTQK